MVENGCVVELGTHEELMAKNGAYAELVRTQELRHGEVKIVGSRGCIRR